MLSIGGIPMLLPLTQVRLLAPLPRPSSIRLFSAFEAHTAMVYGFAQQSVPPTWYQSPAFTFGHHGAVYGPDAHISLPLSGHLDYELGIACVIGSDGRDIRPDAAADYIAGYTIINSWVSRHPDWLEPLAGLTNAKNRDFALSLGPWLVTPDELELYAEDDGRHNLMLIARVNQIERSRDTLANIGYTFAEMIAYASRDTMLYAGDVLGSGPCGTGSLFAVSGGYGPWLAAGDQVELEITALGTLSNQIAHEY
ncbi:MAG: fumarylacetoacetate hydrolase family protein [Chloroflexaceae bacterium]|nr:fumarylacetoacetate hydrolase family protein [Chloroflexaceae bacterium]